MFHGGLSTERAKNLINEIAELNPAWLIVEGGEPLLRPDIFELLESIRQRELEVHLITNGMLLNCEILAMLKRLDVKIMISIDGATATTYEKIRSGADFAQVTEWASISAQEGILEAINFAIMKTNYTEIPEIFELATLLRAPKLNLFGLKPCHNYTEELLSPQEYEEVIKLTCLAAQKTGIEFFFDEPFFWATVKEWGLLARMPTEGAGIIFPETTACIFGEYLFIEPNGEVKPCSFAPLILGNINARTLGEVWQDALNLPLLNRIKNPKNRKEHCSNCSYLIECKGCRSRSFVLTKDWFAADPCCPLNSQLDAKEVK
jgi:radical SAM protein with 4Fe4S-binding SPASM domain